MTTSTDVRTRDGRVLRAHDGGDALTADPVVTVLWHHGSPQTGAPLAPVLDAAVSRGIRLLSYGRPSYGGSTPNPGRDVASAAADVAAIADALDVGRFAVVGASGGGPHALACAALLPSRVTAVVALAGIAPFDADGLDWYAGMADTGAVRAAAEGGRGAREAFEETAEFEPSSFNDADYAALDARWSALGADVGVAAAQGPAGLGGLVDDDVAFTTPWGFDVSDIRVPTLVVQGGDDRVVPLAHGRWLADHLPNGEAWWRHHDGHIGVLDAIPAAFDWILENAAPR
ncbi:pimeloyl-ACP methyl ester carboxylesterase [Labedella gwakjiensis]|uniref:Alpha/beta hydrolase n=1 Tax=Labedella gwakjiensis TaxID=390269 RepID=A0A2P8GT79_9MICO|nr:alpha/beta hydrolase [Labedella gwakjiensis]PSL37169.1 pimeloyl-ACP methyl ester carboxylesterase [Labedella gwakjiensis]RUQ81934.1 alpha/beta hydrolase [Labedella gwakjiensis]